MLLVLGFVGTVISLERAVALRRRIGFAAPALLGIAALALVSPLPLRIGQALLVLGSAALVLLYLPLWRRQRDDAVLVQSLGAVLATGAAVLWLGGVSIPAALAWLVGFVVLTIGGERLELARFAMDRRPRELIVLLSGIVVAAVPAALLWPAVGYRILGAALLGLTMVLLIHDVARKTVHGTGLARFAAACMLAGYGWLLVAGATWFVLGAAPSGSAYDAIVHSVFLGYTISMIMAHAPVILPAVLRRPLPYHPVYYVPAALLQVSLIIRILFGDAWGLQPAWRIGGLLNIIALLAFVVLVASSLATAPVNGARR